MSESSLTLPISIAAILGVVEGLTEFLPVSSTGHLIIAGQLFGFTDDKTKSFEVWIQLGAILAVVWHERVRLLGLFTFLRSGVNEGGFAGRAGILRLGFACVPMLLLGFLLHPVIKHTLMTPLIVGIGFFVGGMLLILSERRVPPEATSSLDELSLKQSILIGLFQCLALWPGMSRSGSTIIGGLLSGVNRKVSTEFSFLVAIPIMVAAVGYDFLKNAGTLTSADIAPFCTGFFVSFIVALFALRLFVRFVGTHSLAAFGWYRIVAGVAIILTLTV